MSVAREQTRDGCRDREPGMASRLDINIVRPSQAWQSMPDVDGIVCRALDTAAVQSEVRAESGPDHMRRSVTVVLSDDGDVQKLNHVHRGVDKPTNVLSFPSLKVPGYEGEDQTGYLGDIVLAFDTIDRESKMQGCTFQDHVSHLSIHGFLHLLGYDHETDDRAAEMEGIEVSALAGLGIANPYADVDPKN